MDIFLDPSIRRRTTRQLYDQLRDAIVAGRLRPGDRLPPSRQLATELGVARQTVATVYAQLAAEGHIAGQAGAGTFVSTPETVAIGGTRQGSPARARAISALRPVRSPGVVEPSGDRGPWRYDLQCGSPDPDLFPVDDWRRAMAPLLRRRPSMYGDPAGSPSLRVTIARFIARSRGVVADENDVVITSGAHQAVDLVARVLVRPGDTVAVEDPGYPDVRRIFESHGVRVVPVPVDGDGLSVADLPANARVVYVTPSHQFPLGVAMSLQRRRALLRYADSHNVAVIEDDYDSEFRHVDRPLEPLHRLDGNARVVYVGSFSKVLSPSLRIGFAVLPPSITSAVVDLMRAVDPVTAGLLHDALDAFITSGSLDRHLRRARRVYRERRQLVTAALRRDVLAPWVQPIPGHAGLHLSAFLRDGIDERDVIEAAAQRGTRLDGLRDTYAGADGRHGLQIGFGLISTADLPDALDAVADSVQSAA